MIPPLAAALAIASCPVEGARYALRGASDVTARFVTVDSGRDWPSGLALVIRFARTGDRTWWLPWDGGTDARQNLASTTDIDRPGWRPPSPDGGPRPLGDVEFLSMDAHYDVVNRVPRRGDAAPGHLLIPHLGEATWYHGATAYRDRPNKRFFDLVRCGPSRRGQSSRSRDQPAGPSTSIGR